MSIVARRRRALVPGWARWTGKKISEHSRGLAEVLARAAEPAMRYSALYLVLQMAPLLSFLRYQPAIGAATTAVIAGPELALLGAINVAEDSIKAEDKALKFWGWVLALICLLLAVIMVATFGDIFKVWTLDDQGLNFLSFARCIIAVSFGIVLGKLDQGEADEDETPATQAGGDETKINNLFNSPASPDATPEREHQQADSEPASPASDLRQQATGEAASPENDAASPCVTDASEQRQQATGEPVVKQRQEVAPSADAPASASSEASGESASDDLLTRYESYRLLHPEASQSDVASALGVSRSTLQRRLKKLTPSSDADAARPALRIVNK